MNPLHWIAAHHNKSIALGVLLLWVLYWVVRSIRTKASPDVTQPAHTINIPASVEAISDPQRQNYFRRVATGLDIFANTLIGGMQDVTLSASSYRSSLKGNKLGKFMCWWLNFIQKDHGKKAFEGDIQRAEDAIAYLTRN